MKLEEALNESPCNVAECQYNNLFCVVDGTTRRDRYTITTGRQGYPSDTCEYAQGLEAAVALITCKGLLCEAWTPIQGE